MPRKSYFVQHLVVEHLLSFKINENFKLHYHKSCFHGSLGKINWNKETAYLSCRRNPIHDFMNTKKPVQRPTMTS